MSEDLREEKQNFLREAIMDAGFDSMKFVEHLEKTRG